MQRSSFSLAVLVCSLVFGLATSSSAGSRHVPLDPDTGAPVSADFDDGGSATANVSAGSGGTIASSGVSVTSSGGTLTLGTNSYWNGGSYNTYTGATITGLTNTIPAVVAKFPELSGSAGDLKITSLNDGNTIRIKTDLSVSNTGTKAAKNVTATVYVSDDAVLDTTKDTKVKTFKLSDYVPDATKLKKGETLSFPIKYKVPTAIASVLEGKYLIAVLGYDSTAGTLGFLTLGTTAGTPAFTVTTGLGGGQTYNLSFNTTPVATTSKNLVIIGPIHLPTAN